MSRPLRTVGKAQTLAGPGDVICLAGRFVEDVTFHRGGTQARPLVLRARPGSRAEVKGRMWVSNAANDVVIQDLMIDGRNLDGGDLPSPTISGDRVRLLRNDISNRRHHICVILGSIRGYGQARDTVLDGNRIHDCGRRPANNHHHGVYIENSVGARIINNVIMGSADRGIQLYPSAQRTLIARNIVVDNGVGVIFSGNEGYASNGNRVVDNVITHSRLRYNIEYWWPAGNPVGSGNVAARNCVWRGNWGNIAEEEPGLRRGFSEQGNVEADPRFVNRTTGDLRMRSGTRCRPMLSGLAPTRRVPAG